MRHDPEIFTGAKCRACSDQREHTLAELRAHHPLANHEGWTPDELAEIARKLAAKLHEKAEPQKPQGK